MRDLNFLNSHIDNKTNLFNKYKNLMIGIIALVLILSCVYAWNVLEIHNLNVEISDAKAFVKSSDNLQKLNTYRDTVNKTEALKKYYVNINSINDKLDNVDRIKSTLVEEIAALLPQSVFIQSMSIAIGNIELSGTSETRVSLAEFQHNLKQQGIFSDVFISSINREANVKESYSFTLKCGLKGVKNSEVK